MTSYKYLPFKNSDTARLIPWVLGVTLFLALTILCFGTLYQAFVLKSTHQPGPSVTIELSGADTKNPNIDKTLRERFERIPAITARFVRPSEIQKGLENFIKKDTPLPYPKLIHVWSKLPPHVSLGLLREELKDLPISPQYIMHRPFPEGLRAWQKTTSGLMATLVLIGYMCFFVLFALCITTQLRIHRPVLDLLVVVGGTTAYIRKQFYAHLRRSLQKGFWLGFISFCVLFSLLYLGLDMMNKADLMASWPFIAPFLLSLVLTLGGLGILGFVLVFWMVRSAAKAPSTLFQ